MGQALNRGPGREQTLGKCSRDDDGLVTLMMVVVLVVRMMVTMMVIMVVVMVW